MLLLKKIFFITLLLSAGIIRSQSGPYLPATFTWEGALTGNQAVWNADDTLNMYNYINSVNVTVKLLDSLKLNTTTLNPSEFNDYTKTNTFFRRGSLAFQITSKGHRQAACLEFTFSKPIYLNKFNIWDIDMLQSSSNLPSTFQDSLHVFASNAAGNVPLNISAVGVSPTFSITGQQMKANFFPGVNGDVTYNDPNGAVLITSTLPLQKFTICYANGSEDDGLSNSHAIRVPEFTFSELVGSIEGHVLEDITSTPLSGSLVRLLDQDNNPVYNKQGMLMEMTTGPDGSYAFYYLPIGNYKVIQTDPAGYNSVRDIDLVNDNAIAVALNVSGFVSAGNDFIEEQAAPLPVVLKSMDVRTTGKHSYRVFWEVQSELNNDFYEISLSADGVNYFPAGRVSGLNQQSARYNFDLLNVLNTRTYVKLTQSDFDGRVSELAIREITQNNTGNTYEIYPNPVSQSFRILRNEVAQTTVEYKLSDTSGKLVMSGLWSDENQALEVDLSSVKPGVYVLTMQEADRIFVQKLVKQ